MANPHLTTAPLDLGCIAINDGPRTVAIASPQGHVDWLLASPADQGTLLREVVVEPHLSFTRGLKFVLHLPDLTEEMTAVRAEILDGGARARLIGEARSPDGAWTSRHEAVLAVNRDTRRYEWSVVGAVTCAASPPQPLHWLEFNNIYPTGAGRGMLLAPHKRFQYTLLVDRAGTAWKFPHQHALHYGQKIDSLRFAVGTVAGFFEEDLNPVVIVDEASLEPHWGICDMYYDLHCGLRVAQPVAPGTTHHWRGRMQYWDRRQAATLAGAVRLLGFTAGDYQHYHWPRLTLGRNDLRRAVTIDDAEEACGFQPKPPVLVWDKEAGPRGLGALRITNDQPAETVWSARPPVELPAASALQLTALVKTRAVRGKGMSLRIRPYTFHWRPQRHVQWQVPLVSAPVTGTTDWTRVQTPVLRIRPEELDHLAWIDVVLDGAGTGWLTDVGVELHGVEEDAPVSPRSPVIPA